MRAVIQRVKDAAVHAEGRIAGSIGTGLLVLAGIGADDGVADMHYMADKILNLRIFPDEYERMNLSVLDCRGGILLVSQFTLWGDARKGRRPNFMFAAPPDKALELWPYLTGKLRESGLNIQEGIFGAMMDVRLTNWGPVTILLDSKRGF
ncbi:MAG: D-aminoacyl-tRNA deacylase [Bacillota bacterium]